MIEEKPFLSCPFCDYIPEPNNKENLGLHLIEVHYIDGDLEPKLTELIAQEGKIKAKIKQRIKELDDKTLDEQDENLNFTERDINLITIQELKALLSKT